MLQLSNFVYCEDWLNEILIENKILPNPYYDYPFLIIKNFFSKKMMMGIVDSIAKMEEEIQAEVKIDTNQGIIKSDVVEEYRKTNIYELEEKFYKLYQKRFLKFKPELEKFFNVVLTESTDIQVLEYQKDFFYVKHADDSSEVIDKEGNTIGFKCVAPQRKITTVLFGTSYDEKTNNPYSFLGGELVFNYLFDQDGKQLKLLPKAGDMVVFPSNPYFSHEVLPVQQGYRLTLVQWHNAIIL